MSFEVNQAERGLSAPNPERRISYPDGDGILEDVDVDKEGAHPTKWSMGVLNDPTTHEVPGTLCPDTKHEGQKLTLIPRLRTPPYGRLQ